MKIRSFMKKQFHHSKCGLSISFGKNHQKHAKTRRPDSITSLKDKEGKKPYLIAASLDLLKNVVHTELFT